MQFVHVCVIGLAAVGGLCVASSAIMVGLFLGASYRLRNHNRDYDLSLLPPPASRSADETMLEQQASVRTR
jgi:hypothetical protein